MKQRIGQKAFNDLYESNPKIADAIRGTEYDPFYVDDRLPEFYAKVKELMSGNEE